jgi:hypothetical protein
MTEGYRYAARDQEDHYDPAVNTAPDVDVCANCGAPLDLDESGACRWCHAHIRPQQAMISVFDFRDQAGLVPDGLDDCFTSAPFLYLALSTFGMLSSEPAVQQYMRGVPQLLQQIRALSTAVSTAGVRVRDAGLLRDDYDQRLTVYTPEEIWTFDLGFDVIAMIGALDGLPGKTRAQLVSNMRLLDDNAHSHTWKHDLKKAGDGPAAFQELRAKVPHRA